MESKRQAEPRWRGGRWCARLVASGACAAVLPETAAGAVAASKPHRLPVPVRFSLCLAWSGRNADTRPALTELIAVLHGVLAMAGPTKRTRGGG